MTVPAPESDLHLHDRAIAYIAGTQIFNNGGRSDLIEMTPVPRTDLVACADGRFVLPGGEWAIAPGKLEEQGSLIITGDRGTGRRTAALRLLSRANEGRRIYELTPQWKNKPSLEAFRPLARPDTWYLLDMSDAIEDPPGPPPSNFGKRLMDWASEHSVRMIVIAANDTGAQGWAGSAGRAQVRLSSPNARDLAVQELRAAGIQDQGILDDGAFSNIWNSRPKAEETCRLVRFIVEGGERSPKAIADEYRGWKEWLNTEVPKGIGARTLLWAAAFCNGGQRRSVVRMSEQLRRKLGDPRTPEAILADDPVSDRLVSAKLEQKEDMTVLLPASKHGLDAALRAYLWGEFEDPELRGVLTEWLVELLAELSVEDAERVARGVLDIVVRFRDEALLKGLRDKLSDETKRPIAVQTLAAAALDPQFGAHVRASLYTWARTSKAQADLVADVCGVPLVSGCRGRPWSGSAGPRRIPGRTARRSPERSLLSRTSTPKRSWRASRNGSATTTRRQPASTRSWPWPQRTAVPSCCPAGLIQTAAKMGTGNCWLAIFSSRSPPAEVHTRRSSRSSNHGRTSCPGESLIPETR